MGKMPVIGLVGACLASVLASGCGEWLTGGTKKDPPPPKVVPLTSQPISQTPTEWNNKPLSSTPGISGGATGVNTGMPTGNNMPSTTFGGGTPTTPGAYNSFGGSTPTTPGAYTPRSGSISGTSGGISGTSSGMTPAGDGRLNTSYSTPAIDPRTYPRTQPESQPLPGNDLGSAPIRSVPTTDSLAGSGRLPMPPAMLAPMGDHAAQTNDEYRSTSTSGTRLPVVPPLPAAGIGGSSPTPSGSLPAVPNPVPPIPSREPSISLPTTPPATATAPAMPGLPELPGLPVPVTPGIPTRPPVGGN